MKKNNPGCTCCENDCEGCGTTPDEILVEVVGRGTWLLPRAIAGAGVPCRWEIQEPEGDASTCPVLGIIYFYNSFAAPTPWQMEVDLDSDTSAGYDAYIKRYAGCDFDFSDTLPYDSSSITRCSETIDELDVIVTS